MAKTTEKNIKDLEKQIHATDTCIMDLNELAAMEHTSRCGSDVSEVLTRLTGTWHILKAKLAMLLKET